MTDHEMVGWHHGLKGHEFELSKLQELVKDREACVMLLSMGLQSWTRQSN